MKLVINKCFGGFGLSRAAFHRLRELGQKDALEETDIGETYKDTNEVRKDYFETFLYEIDRADPLLVQVVEEMGEAADGQCAELRVVEIPDDVDYEIDEYDGKEQVRERSRSWG